MSQNGEYIAITAAQSKGMRNIIVIMQGIAGISPSPGCRAEKLVARDAVLARRVAGYKDTLYI